MRLSNNLANGIHCKHVCLLRVCVCLGSSLLGISMEQTSWDGLYTAEHLFGPMHAHLNTHLLIKTHTLLKACTHSVIKGPCGKELQQHHYVFCFFCFYFFFQITYPEKVKTLAKTDKKQQFIRHFVGKQVKLCKYEISSLNMHQSKEKNVENIKNNFLHFKLQIKLKINILMWTFEKLNIYLSLR